MRLALTVHVDMSRTLPGKEDVPTSADLAHIQMLPWEVTLVKFLPGRGFDRVTAEASPREPEGLASAPMRF